MNKLLKITAQVVALLIVLYIVIMILLFTFVQTKDFKPIISNGFYEMTGQKLHIDGNIKLRIFPWPRIRASNITIENPKGFRAPITAQYLAKIGQLSVRLKAAALLHGNIQPANVLLNHVHINLITAPNGKTNWGRLLNIKRTPHSDKTDTTPTKPTSPIMDATELPVVQIANTTLHFLNLQTKQKIQINKLQVLSPASRNPETRRILISCQILRDNPKTNVSFKLSANINANPKTESINVKKLHMIAKFFQLKHSLANAPTLIMRGNITIQNSDFSALLNGNFGESEGSIQLAAKRKSGKITSALILKNVYVTPLVEVLTGKDWMDGNINASTRLNTSGKTFQNWIAKLSGEGSFKVSKGKVHGLDMRALLSNTLNQLLSPQQKQPLVQTSITTFNTISASYTISKGMLTTNDFLIDAPKLKATGKGSINLPEATINAKLLAVYLDNPKWKIPIIVSGSLFSPSIQPDTSSIAKQLLKSKYQKNITNIMDKAKQQFKGLFD